MGKWNEVLSVPSSKELIRMHNNTGRKSDFRVKKKKKQKNQAGGNLGPRKMKALRAHVTMSFFSLSPLPDLPIGKDVAGSLI